MPESKTITVEHKGNKYTIPIRIPFDEYMLTWFYQYIGIDRDSDEVIFKAGNLEKRIPLSVYADIS